MKEQDTIDELGDAMARDVKYMVAETLPPNRRARGMVPATGAAQMPAPTSDEFRRNAMLVGDGIQQLQDSERAARAELADARARIEQYQRAEHEYKLKIEGALLDVEVERRRTEKVREAFTALRVRMEGLGRLAADALAELREDDT